MYQAAPNTKPGCGARQEIQCNVEASNVWPSVSAGNSTSSDILKESALQGSLVAQCSLGELWARPLHCIHVLLYPCRQSMLKSESKPADKSAKSKFHVILALGNVVAFLDELVTLKKCQARL